MAEAWRIKRYYVPRVLIDTERVLNPQFPDTVVCLTGSQVEMLRNLTQYLKRRSTFAQGYEEDYYLAPNNTDWVTIATIVAELEKTLMGCDIQGIIDSIDAQTAVISALMQCVCAGAEYQQNLAGRLPTLDGYVNNTDVTYLSVEQTDKAPVTPGTDTEKCEFAQAVFYYTYQLYTETLLPFANSTSDNLVAAIVAATAFGALAGFVGIPVFVLAAIVGALVAWAIEGSIANFTNWLWDNKDEIVCILYNHLPDYVSAASAMAAYIDSVSEISFLDKAVLKTVLASSWHYSWIIFDQDTNGTWDASMIIGQCDSCDPLPVSCASVESCDLLDWNGGTIVCVLGRAQIQGGDSYYLLNTLVAPALPSWVTLNWIPRSTSTSTAKISFGVRDVTSGIEYNLLTTGDETVDIERMDYASLPGAVVGHECQLWVKQESWFGEPVYFCLTDIDPS